MKGALTLTKVRTLVSLYRADIQGAEEHLEAVMRDQWDELYPLLRITLREVVRTANASGIYAPTLWPVDDAQGASSPQPPLPPRPPVLVLIR